MRLHLLPVVTSSGAVGVMALRGPPRGGQDDTRDRGKLRRGGRHFDRSVRLLRVLAQAMSLRDDASSHATEVLRLRQALASHESEEVRLRRALVRRVPGIRRTVATCADEPRSHWAVEQLRERLQREFAQPLVLTRLAEELGVNASHLSEVFARDVGMPFKTYLSMLRLQHAQVLLSDPRRRVSDIARAVGYASADRFRAAFRAWAGLSPVRWREGLRVKDEA